MGSAARTAEGATDLAIGHRLGIAEGTVRTHLQNVYATLGVSSRTAAARALAEGTAQFEWTTG